MRILGIDPGLSGALALIDTDRGTLAVWRMPTETRELATTDKRQVDTVELAAIMRTAAADVAWVEDVWAMADEGPVGAFSFGRSKGVLEGALAALGVPVRYVAPLRWKTDLAVPAKKALAKRRAHALFPACAGVLTSEGKAEAAMISLFGCLTHGTPPVGIAPAL